MHNRKNKKKARNPNILLIATPWIITDKSTDYLDAPIPNGLAYIAAVLRKNNIKVSILDCLVEGYERRCIVGRMKNGSNIIRAGLDDKEIRKHIENIRPDIVGISNFFSSQLINMFHVAKLIKSIDSSITVVVGGVHPSSDPIECMQDKNIDYLIKGEGEYAFLNLIKEHGNKSIENIPGLYFKENGFIRFNKKQSIVNNINKIPWPAYDLLPMDKYLYYSVNNKTNRGASGQKWLPIISSRGCPFGCIFCGANLIVGRNWRPRNPIDFVNEIEFLIKEYGVKNFRIEDSNFTLDINRAIEICNEIVKRKLKIKWSLPNGIRADNITNSLAQSMKNAGCISVSLGVEHGDQLFLNDFINKNLDLKKVLASARILVDAGIPSSAFFMLGFPGETRDNLRATIKLSLKLARMGVMPLFNNVIPLPGTKIFEICRDNKLVPEEKINSVDYLLVSHSRPLIKNSELSAQKLLKIRRNARIKAALLLLIFHPILFFNYPFVLNILKSLNSVESLKNNFKLIITRLNISVKLD